MVGLGGQDAGGCLQIGLVGDQRRCALVGGDAHVLEDEGPQQEVLVTRIGIEGRARAHQPGRSRGHREGAVRVGSADVDLRLRHRCRAQRRSQEGHVGDLVLGDLLGVLRHHGILEGHGTAARDGACVPTPDCRLAGRPVPNTA
ncbi:hypothetical protein GY15_02295 [Delftia sp. 670]|nr:hypothetical protein GY15_02295 [Delftia sp. 670]